MRDEVFILYDNQKLTPVMLSSNTVFHNYYNIYKYINVATIH